MSNTTSPATETRASLDYVARIVVGRDGHDDDCYRLLGAEWGAMDDGEDLAVLMVPAGTAPAVLAEIETLLESDPGVAAWCPLVDPGETLDDKAWSTAIASVR